MPDLPLHEPGALETLAAETDAEFRSIALNQFREDLSRFIRELVDAPSRRKRIIHTMASSAALMGAARLAAFCLDLESRSQVSEAELSFLLRLAQDTARLYEQLA